MRPFPDPLTDPLIPDPDLQAAFDAAITTSDPPLPAVAFTIVALNDPGASPHSFAGQRGAEMHYSASILKVAAMYAAFELRKAANDLLKERGAGPADVFTTLKAEFDPVILDNLVPQLKAVDPQTFLPKYNELFDVLSQGGVTGVNFNPTFFGLLHDAIARSQNAAAGACVHKLGYGYITRAVTDVGLFDPDSANGVWLGGDFSQGFPKVTVNSVNDGQVAQAMSTDMMARLYTFLFDRLLVDNSSSDAMQGLLAAAVQNGHFFLSRTPTLNFATLATKIGVGPLKTGASVASEASILRDVASGRHFVAVWQNRVHTGDASIAPVSRVVGETIRLFV